MNIEIQNNSFIVRSGRKGAKPLASYPYSRPDGAVRGAQRAKQNLLDGNLVPYPDERVLRLENSQGFVLAEASYASKNKMQQGLDTFQAELQIARRMPSSVTITKAA